MGIDIYARWKGQRPTDVAKQRDEWPGVLGGSVGYLREAYHGNLYATRHLVPEAFATPTGVRIPASVLRERLPETLKIATLRQKKEYGITSKNDIEPVLQSFRDFVELCERVEAKTGEPVLVLAWW